MPWGAAAVELVRNARPTAGALLLAYFGVYGGGLAARFIHPFNITASAICAMALFSGVVLAIMAAIPPVLRSWPPNGAASRVPLPKGVGSTLPSSVRRR